MNPPPPGNASVAGRPSLRAFRIGWTIVVVLATGLPYVLNRLSTPAGTQYAWIMPPYPRDSFAYMAWSQQAAHGSLLFRLKYTALPHGPFLFQPFFLICGWLSALLGCHVGIVHLVVKSVGVAFFLAVFYRYTDFLGLSASQSKLASVLVGASSGLGAFVSFFDPTDRSSWASSADLWVVDINTWWSLLWGPLFPCSLTLMLLAIFWMDRGTREGRRSDLWRSGLATGAQVLVHPYSQPLLFTLVLVLALARRRAEAAAFLWRYALAALPAVLYVDAVAVLDPLVSRHNAQAVMASPPFTACLLGFGLPLLLAAAGAVALLRRRDVDLRCAGLWFALSCAFAFLPFWFQRKLLFGAHVPLSILAGASPEALLARLSGARARPWIPRLALAVFLTLAIATPVYLLVAGYHEAQANPDGAYYIDDGLMEGLRFLRERSDPQSVVFATPRTSLLIPAFSGNTVVWGHWAQSVDHEQRERWFAALFRPGSDWNDVRRSRRFWGTGIDYILADGPLSRSMQKDEAAWRLILADADRVFANGSVVIYRRRS